MLAKRIHIFLVGSSVLWPVVAFGAVGGIPLVSFGEGVLDFITHVLGPILFGLGLAAAFVCMTLGFRDGLHKALYACAGGAGLFSIGAIVDFVQRLVR